MNLIKDDFIEEMNRRDEELDSIYQDMTEEEKNMMFQTLTFKRRKEWYNQPRDPKLYPPIEQLCTTK